MKHGEAHGVRSARRFGLLDFVIIALLALAAIAFVPAMHSATPATVEISIDGRLFARYPLNVDKSITVEGREGPLSIVISDMGVTMDHATCKNQVCAKTGRISRPFQQIICAPNHCIIEITSSRATDSIDALLQ